MKKMLQLDFRFLLLLGLFFSSSISLLAQNTVTGTITDAGDGEPLIGANVLIKESGSGTATDFDGRYSVTLEDGTYNLVVSYTGYSNKEVTVTVSNGQTLTQDIAMSSDALGLDEVVVTGTFSGRTQKESPLSMTMINGKQIQKLSTSSQADVLRTIPGVTAEGGGGEVATNVFIRGLPAGGQFQYTPLQVDGLPVLSTFGLNSSAHDVYFRNDIGIRNLEFVRGGSSTLFGAGSVAGIINYSSITGSANPENRIELEWANGGRAKVGFLSSGPISENTFYAVSGFYRYDEGPLDTGLKAKGAQIRGNIKRLFNDGTGSLTISGQFIDDAVPFYLPYPLENDNGSFSRPTGNDGETVYTTLTGAVADMSFSTPNGQFTSPIKDGVTTKGGYLMMNFKQAFENDWAISAKAKYANYAHSFNLFLDGDGIRNLPEAQVDYMQNRELPGNGTFTYMDNGQALSNSDLLFENRILDRNRPMEELSSEFNLTKTIGNHNITIGTFAANTEARDDNWIWNFLGDFSNSPRLVGLTYTDSMGNEQVYSNGGFIAGRQTSKKVLSTTKYAFYIGDEIKGEKFNFDIGLRYEKAIGSINSENGIGSNLFNRGTVSASDVAVALAGLYKLNSSTNIYANFSRGYFFPQIRSVRFSSPGVTQSYDPEQIIQGEIGVKYGAKSLAITAAAFYVGLDDRRNVDFVNDGQGGVIEEVSLQASRSIGLEATINYFVTSDFSVNANFTLQDPQLTKNESDPSLEGNRIRRFPNVMGMVGLYYDNNVIDASLTSNFIGKKFTNDANNVELPAHNIVRLDAGYRVQLGDKDQSMRIGLSVFNLLDSDGVTEGSPRQGTGQSSGDSFFVGRPILPRRFFVKVGFNF